MKKTLSILICLVLVMSFLPIVSYAEEMDTKQPMTMNITYNYADEYINVDLAGAEFSIYYVAEVNGNGNEFTLSEDFKPYEGEITDFANLNDLKSGELLTLAGNLKGLVQLKGIKPYATGTTSETGSLSFPCDEGESLKAGLYLMVGKNVTIDGRTFVCTPALVSVPYFENIDNSWYYDVAVEPKCMKYENDGEKISITATKVWDDKESGAEHPAEVTVHLYNGSEVVDTVKLDASNKWTKVWEDLDKCGEWYVSEEAVENFTWSVERTEDTFVVTNTIIKIPPKTPDKPEDEKELPQTGVLWWPAAVLAVVGIVFVVIGITIRKKKNEKSV